MNENQLDQLVDALVMEAVLSSGPDNVTGGDGMGEPGGTTRLQAAGEFHGSPTWPYQMPKSDMWQKTNKLIQTQAQDGLGNVTSSSPAMFEDEEEDQLGSLLSELAEAGFEDVASEVVKICENPENSDVPRLLEFAAYVNAKGGDEALCEDLQTLSSVIAEVIEEK